MIDELFLLRVVLSFVVGGLYIAAITRLSELLGSRVGGILSAIPTTGLVGMVFLGITEGTLALTVAAPSLMVGFSVSTLFLITYAYLRSRNQPIAYSLGGATLLWLTIMAIVGLLGALSVQISLIVFLICFVLAQLFFRRFPTVKPVKKPTSAAVLAGRAAFAGTMVALSIVLGRVIGPNWGGIAAAFPALYFSSIVILEKEQGKEFTISLLKRLPLGSISLALFAVGLSTLASTFSLAVTITGSMLVSIVYASCILLKDSYQRSRNQKA